MQISYTHKFIFVHVAKVAGLSIRKALSPYTQEPERFRIRRPQKMVNGEVNPLYTMWQSTLTHVTARAIRRELPADTYNDYYKFAFVRNPWDWHVSMYHFILKEKEHVNHQVVSALGTFDNYLEWAFNHKRNPYAKGATRQQHEMLVDDNGALMVDFVGRFENLASDFEKIMQTIAVNVSLPAINQSKHESYMNYYNEKRKKLVAEHSRQDILLFDYKFDGYGTTEIDCSAQARNSWSSL
jgi:hypothetical protein